jgi:hypothetical protein
MTAREAEAADIIRVRKAYEFLAHSRTAEGEARRILADAIKQTARANERYQEIFTECENRAFERRKSGAIEVTPVC